ncbi:outer membrane beta-barrel protein [Winogradskyella endarachnes]|uniref:Outer membrane beta-barrel protein n=1 Tax=Winogradskyella endarachnes TaxID=2681965 RepID=A0A6L6UCR3_9FLAO|nr:outer membrane beta-barrel protein [Winogradskyella endarachnes]MUU79759.1 outer membrane beta-barrel protein [Winogradskyella endarachnes]
MRNLKKSVISTALLLFIGLGLSAQNKSSFGFKGGLNYGANGDYFDSVNLNYNNPDENIGYHIGIFGKIGNKIYLRPEIVYTVTKSDYENNDFNIKKIDVPVLVGIKVLGPVSVFAGPSAQYILETDFHGIDIDDLQDDFTVGLNFGIGLNFNKIGIDLRYERGFGENEASFIENNITSINSRIDTRPEQLILSLSIGL